MSKTKCSNCDKEIDANKFFLHERYCSINVRKCSICNEPIQKDEYDEHKIIEHPKPKCDFCQLEFSKDDIDEHKKICTKKLYECQYCGLYMNKNELNEHEYQCGSKTMKCEICGENVIKTTYDLHLEYECKKNSLHKFNPSNWYKYLSVYLDNSFSFILLGISSKVKSLNLYLKSTGGHNKLITKLSFLINSIILFLY